MKYLMIFSVFFTFSLLAAESVKKFPAIEVWKMGDQFFEFIREENGVLYSRSCGVKNCQAKKFLKSASFKNIPSSKFSGGKNPGAVLCHENKNAEVIFLKDLNGNDNSFCLFKDKSMVSSSSIEIEAKKNDSL